ncbi:MAG: histidine phosphatase family protein [Oryzihumus sp.]
MAGDLDAGCPGGEDGHTLVNRYREAVGTIADQHRGETVLVFSHGGVMSLVLPRLALNARNDLAAQRFLPNCVPAELAVDADGWLLRSWPRRLASRRDALDHVVPLAHPRNVPTCWLRLTCLPMARRYERTPTVADPWSERRREHRPCHMYDASTTWASPSQISMP